MSKSINLFKVFILIIIYTLPAYCYGDVLYLENSQSIYNCVDKSSTCEIILVPDELIDDITDSNLSIDNFLGERYLLLTPKHNASANICYSSYSIKENKIDPIERNILGSGNINLCQYRKINNQIISRYRDAGKWIERLYQEEGGKYKLLIEDQCIGCGTIYRIIFNNNYLSYKLVSDKDDLYKREQLTKFILTDKSFLYANNDEKSKTRMYLVKGDKVNLLNVQDDFYEIEYTTKSNKIIKKWLHCSAIDACVSSD